MALDQHCKVCPVLTYNSGGKYDNWETSSSTEMYQRSVLAKTLFTTLLQHLGYEQCVTSFENVSNSPRDQPTGPFLQTRNVICALVTGERYQSLHLMNFVTMVKSPSSYWFVIKTTEGYNDKLENIYQRKPTTKIFLTQRSNYKKV